MQPSSSCRFTNRSGFVTFAHFTCQHRCALKDRTKENQSLGALDVGAKSTENGLFLASVTMPAAWPKPPRPSSTLPAVPSLGGFQTPARRPTSPFVNGPATLHETGPADWVLTLMRRLAKAAAEFVELVEISEGDANVAALATAMPNRDFSPERQGEFVLKCKRVGVDGRGRLSRSWRFARIFAETLNVSHGHAFGDDAVGKRVRLGDGEERARMPR